MAAGIGLVGRDITMTVGGATLLGVVTKDFTVANSALEVTDDQASGWRELLAKGGLKTVSLSVSGPVKNYELLNTLFQTTQMVEVVVDLGDGATTESNLTFDALITEMTFGGDANEVNEYSATLESSGVPSFTAGT